MVDGELDNVYAASLVDRIVLLHHGDETVEKRLTLPNGSERAVALPPNAIVEIAVENRP